MEHIVDSANPSTKEDSKEEQADLWYRWSYFLADPRADLIDFVVDDSASVSLFYSSQESPAFLAGSEKFLPVVGIGKAGAAEGDSSLLEYFDVPFVENASKWRTQGGVSVDGTFPVVDVV